MYVTYHEIGGMGYQATWDTVAGAMTGRVRYHAARDTRHGAGYADTWWGKLSYACSFAFTTTATFEIPGCPGQCNEASGQVAPRSMAAAYM